jgi:hypothetical protein
MRKSGHYRIQARLYGQVFPYTFRRGKKVPGDGESRGGGFLLLRGFPWLSAHPQFGMEFAL